MYDPMFKESTLHKVELGSGIGMKHSGAVSDLVFAMVVAVPLLAAAAELGILTYLRFRDDVSVHVEDPPASKAVREKLVGLANTF